MKVIATDLDGTLLSAVGEISERNASAIRKAQQAGIEVIVATGRSYDSAKRPLDKAGLSCPIICLNGANYYTLDGEMTRSIPLSKEIIHQIIAECQKFDSYYELYTNRGIYSTDRTNFMEVLVNILLSAHPGASREEVERRATQRFQEEEFNLTSDFDALLNEPTLVVYKVLAFSLEVDGLEKIKAPFLKRADIKVTSSGYDNAEFNHPNGQKGTTLASLLQERGIDLADVMAIGDNFNDLSMLEIVGRSVAMGNAEQAIKDACRFHTLSNEEDGVALAIEAIL